MTYFAKDPCGVLQCPANAGVHTLCASGSGRDCATSVGGDMLAATNCTPVPSYAIDTSQPTSDWKWSGNTMLGSCANGVLNAVALSGGHQDCPFSSRNGVRCIPLVPNAFIPSQPAKWENANDMGQTNQTAAPGAVFAAKQNKRFTVQCKPGTYPVAMCNNGGGDNDCRGYGVPNGGYTHLKCAPLRPSQSDLVGSLAQNRS